MRLVLIAGALAGLALMTSWPTVYAASGDKAASLAAFDTVAKVMTHPRCMNCHTTTAWPTQGDKSERHGFNVVRGPDGRGQGACAARTATRTRTSRTSRAPRTGTCHR